MQRLERTELLLVRRMCGASLKERTSSVELNNRQGVDSFGYCEAGAIEVVWASGA